VRFTCGPDMRIDIKALFTSAVNRLLQPGKQIRGLEAKSYLPGFQQKLFLKNCFFPQTSDFRQKVKSYLPTKLFLKLIFSHTSDFIQKLKSQKASSAINSEFS